MDNTGKQAFNLLLALDLLHLVIRDLESIHDPYGKGGDEDHNYWVSGGLDGYAIIKAIRLLESEGRRVPNSMIAWANQEQKLIDEEEEEDA